ncbi:MAG: VOC family protein [Pyrinomonadaceae bacterium]
MRISRIILFVDDIVSMARFYSETVGAGEHRFESEMFVVFETDGAELCLHQTPEQYRNTNGEYPPREDSNQKFVFHSDEPLKEHERLVFLGVSMREPVKYGDLILCDGFDPEGNVFQISNR